ncbi:nucleotidyltransferase family protein [Methylophilus aquaticus]|uniref:Nucleotidyltransferase family protein n=1 Tax=Methylophilus aquaticus TaxID=1971610 RepID=A0ABT9JWB5_9PROT|nr:nucleotidyltransferase family protein [Methylophilus aquaticus]MDP8568879.1 nucleotidyltransferase family protein [Methylophilus aquaticus]
MQNAQITLNPPPLVVGILLAAGFSRRFGDADKLLQPFEQDATVAEVSARHLRQVIPFVVAVIRPENSTLHAALSALGLQVVMCDAHEMADSLKYAIQAAQALFPALSGYVLALADMPLIKPATIFAVAQHIQTGAQIVQPVFQGKRGHPVGFSRRFTPALLSVQGDQGARGVLKQYAEEITLLECTDHGILQDIDTPEALREARSGSGETGFGRKTIDL